MTALQADSGRLQLLTEHSSLRAGLQALPPQAEAADYIANLPSDRTSESMMAASVPGLSFAPLHSSESSSASWHMLVPPCPELWRGPWGGQTSPSMLSSLLGCICAQSTFPAHKGSRFFSLTGKLKSSWGGTFTWESRISPPQQAAFAGQQTNRLMFAESAEGT